MCVNFSKHCYVVNCATKVNEIVPISADRKYNFKQVKPFIIKHIYFMLSWLPE
jgi:hypothetical protein